MKRPDQIKIDRPGPMFVVYNCDNIKTICIVVQWLGDDTEMGLKMFILRSLFPSCIAR